jgi:hypothetical protein
MHVVFSLAYIDCIWHVDDGLPAALRGWIEKILKELNSGELEVVDLGEPSSLLNCKVEQRTGKRVG